jgi:hypothetical protein
MPSPQAEKRQRTDANVSIESLERDPGLRGPIHAFPQHDRDRIRRLYIELGEFLSNLMVLYVEKDLAQTIDIETIINKFGTIGNRRLQLK